MMTHTFRKTKIAEIDWPALSLPPNLPVHLSTGKLYVYMYTSYIYSLLKSSSYGPSYTSI